MRQDRQGLALMRLDHDPLKGHEVLILSIITNRPAARFITWYICPPGATRAFLAIRQSLRQTAAGRNKNLRPP